MGIFAKLTQIAENMEEVHEAGYNKGKAVGYKEGLDTDAYEAGKKAEYDAFWDAFTDNGNRTDYGHAFSHWGNEYIRPNRKIIPTTAGSGANVFIECPKLKKVEAACFDFSQKPKATKQSISLLLSRVMFEVFLS